MYAVIRAGGKQQKVKPGDVIEVEHLGATAGDTVTFDPVLVVDDDGKTHLGKELAKGSVKATTLGDKKGDKIRVFRYKAKTGYSKRQGHRQLMTVLEIEEIGLAKKAPPKTAKAEMPEEKPAKPADEKPKATKPARAKADVAEADA